MTENVVRAAKACLGLLLFGLAACPSSESDFPDASVRADGGSGGSSGGGGGGGGTGDGAANPRCLYCPRQAPDLGNPCVSPGAVCAYENRSSVLKCKFFADENPGSTLADGPTWSNSGIARSSVPSCPDTKPAPNSPCRSPACLACEYLNGCEKPTTTLFCDPDKSTWVASPMDATNPQIPHCTPGNDAGSTVSDAARPTDVRQDAATEANACTIAGAPPSCVCTYPDGYVGYTICSYGSNTDIDHSYIWPKSDSRYWGREVICAPRSLCEFAKTCDSDPNKLCCSPNNSGIWNIECKFTASDAWLPERRKACCR
jgi:hypothetical protein